MPAGRRSCHSRVHPALGGGEGPHQGGQEQERGHLEREEIVGEEEPPYRADAVTPGPPTRPTAARRTAIPKTAATGRARRRARASGSGPDSARPGISSI